MPTTAEIDAVRPELRNATWAAAALAALASLLHWISTSTATHTWSLEAATSVVAGCGLMALAMLLAARRLSPRTARAIHLAGAAGTTAVVLAFLLLVLVGAGASGGLAGHEGHGAEDGGAVASVDVIRVSVEVTLVGVLVWLHRLTGRSSVAVTRATG